MESLKTLRPEKKEKLQKDISNLVDHMSIGSLTSGGFYVKNPVVFTFEFKNISNLFKGKCPINTEDFSDIVQRAVDKVLGEIPFCATLTPLGKVTNSKQRAEIKKVLYDYCLELPFEHEVIFPLVSFPLIHTMEGEDGETPSVYDASDQVFEISDNIKIFYMTEERRKKEYPAIEGYEKYDDEWHGVHVSIKTYGYEIVDEKSAALYNATKDLKILIAALLVCNVFSSTPPFGLYGSLYKYGVHCYAYPRFEGKAPAAIRMDYQQSYVLASMGLNHNALQPDELEEQKIKKGEVENKLAVMIDRLRKQLKPIQKLFAPSTDNQEDAERIQAALLWFFDGLANRNKTFSFIQYSTAVEALIGEPGKHNNIRERLADRCAYIIGRTSEERTRINEEFTKAYTVRSQIVHRRKTELKAADIAQYDKIREILVELLEIEINNLL